MSMNIPVKKERRVSLTSQGQLDQLMKLKTQWQFTPGNTMFQMTPGGTRIFYDRDYLVNLASSPAAQKLPSTMPKIPGVTLDEPHAMPAPNNEAITVIPEEKSKEAAATASEGNSKGNKSVSSAATETTPEIQVDEMEGFEEEGMDELEM